MSFADYYNRFTPQKQWESVLFRANRGGQSAELNELQDILSDRINRLGRGIYQDGHVVEGSVLTIAPAPAGYISGPYNNVSINDGRIALRGTVYDIPGALFSTPLDQVVWVGIRFHTVDQDEFADPTLLNPAIGTRGYQEAGAGRRRAEWAWGWLATDGTHDANGDWDFYPVYEIDHNVLVIRQVPPGNDPLLALLAKYDREAHGNYVVRGYNVSFIADNGDGTYTFDVTGGLADIQGYKIERRPDTRLVLNKDITEVVVTGEPHHYDGTWPGGPHHPLPPQPLVGLPQTIYLNRSPVTSVQQILCTKWKQVTNMIKGAADTEDTLPDATIVNVLRVYQGDTEYANPTDWTLDGDKINWAPAGAEPAPSSTYTVEYTYETTVMPDELGADYIIVSGLVIDTEIYVDYKYALPRKDLIAIQLDGELVRLEGVSKSRNPTSPRASADMAPLATVFYDWLNPPVVEDVSARSVPFTQINKMEQRIVDLYELVAIGLLHNDPIMRQEAERLGIFVDPFTDDSERDFGLDQKAVIASGCLQLPVPSEPYTPDGAADKQWETLDFTLEEVAAQPAKTGCLAIAPVFVVPPPRPVPPPPPPPRPRSRRFQTEGGGYYGFTAPASGPARTSAITGAKSNTNVLTIDHSVEGIIWWMNNRVRYNPPLDATTKADVQTVVNALVDTGVAGTYWGSDAVGSNDTGRSGTMTIGGKVYNWSTTMYHLVFHINNLYNRHMINVNPTFEWTGAVPSDGVINAQIASMLPAAHTAMITAINAYAGWSGAAATLATDWTNFLATAVVKNERRTASFVIQGAYANRYDLEVTAAFQPNARYENGHFVSTLQLWLTTSGPVDETLDPVKEGIGARVTVSGVYDIGNNDRRPPRRRIQQPPPTVPPNSPPSQPDNVDTEDTFAPEGDMPFVATGFKPYEKLTAATLDGTDVSVVPDASQVLQTPRSNVEEIE